MSLTTQEAYDIFLNSRDFPIKSFSQPTFIKNVNAKMGFVFPLSLHKSVFVRLKRYYEKSRAAKRNKSSADIDWDAVLYTSSMAECPLVILSEEEEETEEDIEEKQRGRGDCEEEEEEKEEGQSQPLAPAKIGVKRKRQHISELCQRQSYRRLDELYALFCETARREEISSARLAGN